MVEDAVDAGGKDQGKIARYVVRQLGRRDTVSHGLYLSSCDRFAPALVVPVAGAFVFRARPSTHGRMRPLAVFRRRFGFAAWEPVLAPGLIARSPRILGLYRPPAPL